MTNEVKEQVKEVLEKISTKDNYDMYDDILQFIEIVCANADESDNEYNFYWMLAEFYKWLYENSKRDSSFEFIRTDAKYMSSLNFKNVFKDPNLIKEFAFEIRALYGIMGYSKFRILSSDNIIKRISVMIEDYFWIHMIINFIKA